MPAIALPDHRDLYYGGDWHIPSGGYVDLIDPATGDNLGPAANADTGDVDKAVRAAHAAFQDWRHTHGSYRSGLLRKIAAVLHENAGELAALDSVCNGNPVSAVRGSIQFAIALLEYFAGLVLELKGETLAPEPDTLRMTLREPLGVCARLVAFNHPLMFFAAKLAAPLAAGNTVMMKAAEPAPLSAFRLMELLRDALPPGVVNVVSGGRACGEALASHPLTPVVTLIGSAQTGRAIIRAGADNMKRHILELGGKNALIVYPDADKARAIQGAVSGMAFAYCGQSCGSTSRLFLHDTVYDEVLDGVVRATKTYVPGLPLDPSTTMGCLISKSAQQRVLATVRGAVDAGARLVLGGRAPEGPRLREGAFVEPTILTEVTADMAIAREEIFGPVLSVLRWHDEGEMLSQVNGVEYGLSTALYSADITTAMRAVRVIEAGTISVNGASIHAVGAPFGGYKQSGFGKEECFEELTAFTRTKTVAIAL